MQPTYKCFTVTLATGGTAYNLYNLIAAAYPTEINDIPRSPTELNLQVHSLPAGTVSVGDSTLSATRRGFVMNNIDSRLYRLDKSVPLQLLWALGSVDAMILNIEAVTR